MFMNADQLRGKFVLRTRPITQLKPTSTVHYQAQRTYRAAQCQELGKPLVLARLPSQELQSGQVRIKVCAAGVNFGDLLMIQGAYQEKPPLPFVAGSELAGEVLDIGDDVTNFRKGDRVVGLTFNLGAFAEEAVCNQYFLVKVLRFDSVIKEMELFLSHSEILIFTYKMLMFASICCKMSPTFVSAGVQSGGRQTNLEGRKENRDSMAGLDKKGQGARRVIGAAGGPEKCQLLENEEPLQLLTTNRRASETKPKK
ncbi:putative quinone oxidoreductase-like protein 2-like isoform X1 [Apostichopus japonicus]|uniref:Putative quinone oxidoreductase-like protein 2-like isoform X1 n=1 Tax=Stichopus japonicus TaxID=307972 RepID=A0A2G8KHM2_STIJA|nr:putative quinone oxidoreductase-like protein 2-like isoform X1 [Apostichopus japonicus]